MELYVSGIYCKLIFLMSHNLIHFENISECGFSEALELLPEVFFLVDVAQIFG